jgi:hypothetical protein
VSNKLLFIIPKIGNNYGYASESQGFEIFL